jgi:hypothetical protein
MPIGIANDVLHPGEAFHLPLARSLHPLADGRGRLSLPVAGEFFIIDTWHFDVDVNPVEHGTGDAFLIFGYGRWGAGTGLFVTPKMATRTGIPTIKRIFHAK